MRDFLYLAAELFMIICIQSLLEVMLYDKKGYYTKVIFFAGYVASLALVLNFAYQHFSKLFFFISFLMFHVKHHRFLYCNFFLPVINC